MGFKSREARSTIRRRDGVAILEPMQRGEVPEWVVKAYALPQYPDGYLRRTGKQPNTAQPEYLALRKLSTKRNPGLVARLAGENRTYDLTCPGLDLARNRAEGEVAHAVNIGRDSNLCRLWQGKDDGIVNEAVDRMAREIDAYQREREGAARSWPMKAALAAYVEHLWIESLLPMQAIAYLAWWEGWLVRSEPGPPGRENVRALEKLMARHSLV